MLPRTSKRLVELGFLGGGSRRVALGSHASSRPWKSSSLPAMILSRVDLPAPLAPITPILAPGIHRDVDPSQHFFVGRMDTPEIAHRDDEIDGP